MISFWLSTTNTFRSNVPTETTKVDTRLGTKHAANKRITLRGIFRLLSYFFPARQSVVKIYFLLSWCERRCEKSPFDVTGLFNFRSKCNCTPFIMVFMFPLGLENREAMEKNISINFHLFWENASALSWINSMDSPSFSSSEFTLFLSCTSLLDCKGEMFICFRFRRIQRKAE